MLLNKRFKINDFGYTKIDFLVFGNPSQSEIDLMNDKAPFYHLFKRYSKYDLLKNSSRETVLAINLLIKKSKEYNQSEALKLYSSELRNNFCDAIFNDLKKDNISFDEKMCLAVAKDIEPLILMLKYYYNQIRPSQLACIHDLQLNPAYTSTTPSFPSERVFKAKVLCEYLKVNNKDRVKEIEEWCEKVCKQTLYEGTNTLHEVVLTKHMAHNLSQDEVFFNKFHKNK